MKARIIVIEDYQELAEIIAQEISLSFPDFEIIIANDGPTALEAIREEMPSLVVFDVVIPKYDTSALLQKLLDANGNAPFPIICTTGLASDDPRLDLFYSLKLPFLFKPFPVEMLTELIRIQLAKYSKVRLQA